MANHKNEKHDVFSNASPSYSWKDRADYKKENRGALRKSVGVALRILDILDERGMSQQDLAKILGVTKQQVSKIVKGQENLTIETIDKLETVLGVELVKVVDSGSESQAARVVVSRKNTRLAELAEILNELSAKRPADRHVVYSTAENSRFKHTYPGALKEVAAGENEYAMAS